MEVAFDLLYLFLLGTTLTLGLFFMIRCMSAFTHSSSGTWSFSLANFKNSIPVFLVGVFFVDDDIASESLHADVDLFEGFMFLVLFVLVPHDVDEVFEGGFVEQKNGRIVAESFASVLRSGIRHHLRSRSVQNVIRMAHQNNWAAENSGKPAVSLLALRIAVFRVVEFHFVRAWAVLRVLCNVDYQVFR